MGITSFIQAYREEQAHPKLTGAGVGWIDAMQIGHWGSPQAFAPFRVANNISSPMFAWNRWWQPMGCLIKRPKGEPGLNQTMQMWIPGHNGAIWEQVVQMTRTQRRNPIVCDLYRFMSDYLDEPVGDADRFFAVSVEQQIDPESGEEQVAFEWSARNLNTHAVGRIYSTDDFPHLSLAQASR